MISLHNVALHSERRFKAIFDRSMALGWALIFLLSLSRHRFDFCNMRQSINKLMNKGNKFLEKLWCCVSEEYYKIIWFYQLG